MQGAKEGDLVEFLAESGLNRRCIYTSKGFKRKKYMPDLDTMMDDLEGGHVGEGFSRSRICQYWNKAYLKNADCE